MDIEQQPKPALPLLALLALASALGIAVAVALAAVAILLAAPAYADEGSLLLERGAGLAKARLLFTQSESEEEGHLRRLRTCWRRAFSKVLRTSVSKLGR